MMNVSRRKVKTKSKKPKKSAVKIEMQITSTVKMIDCFLVGQLTCLSSPFVSFI